jgi:hypothetical protein
VLGWQIDPDDENTRTMPAAVVRRHGRGRIAGVPFDFGLRYQDGATSMARDWLQSIVRTLFPEPIVALRGSHLVDVAVTRSRGRLAIHLVNSGGPHLAPTHYVWDEIPPLGPLDLELRLPRRPCSIMRMPETESVPFQWKDGVAHLRIDRLAVHSTLLVEE